ncbi:MAG: c-type cytochrome biogenesis protein CcmI [Rhodobacter sp.]|uniref:c-type cytochrome biogenesis protein CcmI n=1 Tax=Pararhodobacter sp. TaxID=2127056 RepID=UPI001DC53EF3|nr:c-type cytochrome biogenesis protein CcmI [Pararhodobacter sp.]MCB1344753.1 c-type cytochrome biogenesis protein CcmI [Paracoccaceae bacterium]MCC0072027.1 c-type cytochrome biogenesis protein CcmI [Rhodobacter sp.]HPD94218.1 c-type cytochrome biogenesis protein CcmI [Pararhodobacter sp.]
MTIWWFLGPALALCVLVVGLIALGLARGARVRASEPGEKREMRIYADQLKEIDRDRARGLIPADEAERMRAETARRLLEADRKTSAETVESPRAMRRVALVLALSVPIGAGLLYLREGVPGMGDEPLALRFAQAAEMRAARPSQDVLETDWANDPNRPAAPQVDQTYLDLMTRLREAVANRPGDAQGLRLLAVNEGNLGNHAASARAWGQLIDVEGQDAPVADLSALAEAMVLATGGIVSPQAEVVLQRILERDPRNGSARFYLGWMFIQTGRPDLSFRIWRGLLEDSNPDDPWVPSLRQALPELAQIAGVRYTLPPEGGSRGPSAADMAAAADMTSGERQQMIGNMVEGLAARLSNQGGTPEEWARLINALGVLGQADRARSIWAEARQVFADQPDAMAQIDAAARQQGFSD